MILATARSLRASARYALPFNRAIQTSAVASKASEPMPSESDIDVETDGFQTKIWEVLQMKPEDSHKLWISKDDTVFKAIQKMNKAGVGSLLVYDRSKGEDDGDHPHDTSGCVGILTERDYMQKVVVKGKQSKETAVRDIMTPKDQLHVMTPNNTVLEAMHVMVGKNIRHVPVMDSHCMVGVLSMRDVMRTLLEDQKHEIEYLKDYIGGNSY